MKNNLESRLTAQKATNNFKTIMIMAFFVVIVGALGLFAAKYTGNNTFLYGMILGSVAMNLYSYFFSDKIALSSAGAEEADKNKYSDLYNSVDSLAKKANLKKSPRVYIINDPAPNAFATGRNENHASVAVTTGLLAMMNKGELEGVLAHELAHIKHKDILIMTVVVVLAGVLSYLAQFAFSVTSRQNSDNNNSSGSGVIGLVLGLAASLLIPIASGMIQSSISRKREFMADADGALITGYAEGLASALEKIGGFKQPLQRATAATAHLYISCPFGAKEERQSFFQKLFMTHPPIEERIAILRGQ